MSAAAKDVRDAKDEAEAQALLMAAELAASRRTELEDAKREYEERVERANRSAVTKLAQLLGRTTMSALARETGMSRQHLHELFRKHA